METGDIDQVVSVHIASFSGFFLSFLGPRFLRLYYAGVCASPDGIAFVFDAADKPVGFVAGATNPKGFYSRLLKRDCVKFSLASLGAICKRPSIIKRLARAIFYPSKNPIGDHIAGLFSIGVQPELQRTGIGRQLLHMFLSEAKRRGCKRVFLTTDRDNNMAVNSFYRELGFKVENQYVTPEGRSINEYWIDLS